MLTASDFLRPIGRLDPELLGGGTQAATTLGNLISAAQGKTDDVAAQECFVYWKACEQIADDLMSAPAMQRDRHKADQFASEQLMHWRDAARAYQACYQRAIGAPIGVPATSIIIDVTPKW